MQIEQGSGWKAWNDGKNGRCFGEYGGIQAYHLYELTAEQYEALTEKMSEYDAATVMCEGRHLRSFSITTTKSSAPGRMSSAAEKSGRMS